MLAKQGHNDIKGKTMSEKLSDRLYLTIITTRGSKQFSIHKLMQRFIVYLVIAIIALIVGGFIFMQYFIGKLEVITFEKNKALYAYKAIVDRNDALKSSISSKTRELVKMNDKISELEDVIDLSKNKVTKHKPLDLSTLALPQKYLFLKLIPSNSPFVNVKKLVINQDSSANKEASKEARLEDEIATLTPIPISSSSGVPSLAKAPATQIKEAKNYSAVPYSVQVHVDPENREFKQSEIHFTPTRSMPIFATADGIIDVVNEVPISRFGRYVKVINSFGFTTFYGQLSRVSIEKGRFVSKGDLLGFANKRLDYEVRFLGRLLNTRDFVGWSIANFSLVFKEKSIDWNSLANTLNAIIELQSYKLQSKAALLEREQQNSGLTRRSHA